MIAIAMPAAIRPYSMAVAPDSSFTKRETRFFIDDNSCVHVAGQTQVWSCRRSQHRDHGVTLGCDNFDAVNSIVQKCLELAVLEHSKHRIKPLDKMQAGPRGSFVAPRAVSIDSLDSQLLKRERISVELSDRMRPSCPVCRWRSSRW